jgi:hypothetical protein
VDCVDWVKGGEVRVERPDDMGSGRCEGLLGDVREASRPELGGCPWVSDVWVVSVGFLYDGWCDTRSFGS